VIIAANLADEGLARLPVELPNLVGPTVERIDGARMQIQRRVLEVDLGQDSSGLGPKRSADLARVAARRTACTPLGSRRFDDGEVFLEAAAQVDLLRGKIATERQIARDR